MLMVPQSSRYSFTYNNWGTNPSSTPGTSVTPGASNAEGAWTQIASSANIANDISAFSIYVYGGGTSAAQKDHLLDIGVDPAGGTTYSAIISNIVCGASAAINSLDYPHAFLFPLGIRAGSSVAARVQGNNATAGTVRIVAEFFGNPSRPEADPVGSYSETIGTITNSQGVTFTPGNAADGTWTSLGTTVKPLWWWQIGYQVSNATITNEQTYIELAFGDGTNKHRISRLMHIGGTSEQCAAALNGNLNFYSAYCPVPAGNELFIRGRCANAPDTGYNAVAVGIGG
jgi:hypothetical protein